MTKKILVVLGSVREGRAADKVSEMVVEEIEKVGAEATVADFKKTPLPFYDHKYSPSHPEFNVADTPAADWAKQIAENDAVLFLVPEYNHGVTPVLKNAIDWVYNEWQEKPAGVVYYGFYGGEHVQPKFEDLLSFFKMHVAKTPARLWLGKDLGFDGSIAADADEAEVRGRVAEAVTSLLEEV